MYNPAVGPEDGGQRVPGVPGQVLAQEAAGGHPEHWCNATNY